MPIFRKIYNWWTKDATLIRAYETRTGHKWLSEGYAKKGGLNPPPTTARPPWLKKKD